LRQIITNKKRYGEEKIGECFLNIQQIILKTLQSVQRVISKNKNSFELFEFGVVLDSNLKPWLKTVNSNFLNNSYLNNESQFKSDILNDLCTIIDMEKILTGKEDRVGGFDLLPRLSEDDLIRISSKTPICKLGLLNNREEQLQKLSKTLRQKILEKNQLKKDDSKAIKISPEHPQTERDNFSFSRTRKILMHLDTNKDFLSQTSQLDSFIKQPESAKTFRITSARKTERRKTTPLPKTSTVSGFNSPQNQDKILDTSGNLSRTSSLPHPFATVQSVKNIGTILPILASHNTEFTSTPATPTSSSSRNVNLPPIFSRRMQPNQSEKGKTKLELLIEEAGYDFLKNPISILDANSPSTAASFGEGKESLKGSSLDSQVLKVLHTRSRLKRESNSFRIKNNNNNTSINTSSSNFKKEDIRRMLLKSRSIQGENLDEIKEEEEFNNKQPNRTPEEC